MDFLFTSSQQLIYSTPPHRGELIGACRQLNIPCSSTVPRFPKLDILTTAAPTELSEPEPPPNCEWQIASSDASYFLLFGDYLPFVPCSAYTKYQSLSNCSSHQAVLYSRKFLDFPPVLWSSFILFFTHNFEIVSLTNCIDVNERKIHLFHFNNLDFLTRYSYDTVFSL